MKLVRSFGFKFQLQRSCFLDIDGLRGMQRPRQPASILATTLVFSSVPAGPGFLPPEVTFASTLLMSINRCSATPQAQLWRSPLPYSSFQPTGKNPQIQEENNHLTLPPSSRGPGGNSWVIESDQNYRDIASKEAQKNVDSLESWRDAGLNVPWMHSSGFRMMLRLLSMSIYSMSMLQLLSVRMSIFSMSMSQLLPGLEYRDVATIEAARSVARFAWANQYLGSFKTRQGTMMMMIRRRIYGNNDYDHDDDDDDHHHDGEDDGQPIS